MSNVYLAMTGPHGIEETPFDYLPQVGERLSIKSSEWYHPRVKVVAIESEIIENMDYQYTDETGESLYVPQFVRAKTVVWVEEDRP